MNMDTTTNYMGLELAHPIVPSASPLTGSMETLRTLEAHGAPAVVLPSLFEEQIDHESHQFASLFGVGGGGFAESTEGYFPEMDDYNTGPESYLGLVSVAKNVLSIPVIASLNGTTTGGWTRYAKQIEDAGADALELNVYLIAGDPDVDGREVEAQYLELIASVSESVTIPIAVKTSPYFSSFAHMAGKMVEAGADALVLFNRFYQPDLSLEDMKVDPTLELSRPSDLRLPLRWIAMLYGRIPTQFAATSGVGSGQDVIKLLMAGAQITQTASALLRGGPNFLDSLLSEMTEWLIEHEYESVSQLRGSMSQQNAPDPSEFERHNYLEALTNYIP